MGRAGAREAEAVDDPELIGDAYIVMGWGYGELGKEGGEALMLKSLEAYQRSGNRVRQANILSNLGSACYWDGRWDDAMAYFERGRDETGQGRRSGSTRRWPRWALPRS